MPKRMIGIYRSSVLRTIPPMKVHKMRIRIAQVNEINSYIGLYNGLLCWYYSS